MVRPVWIIAEAGVNHNGDIHLAKYMIEEAARTGVDCVKFQTFKPSALVSKYARQADYQRINMKGKEMSQLEMLEGLQFMQEEYRVLQAYCEKCHVSFLSSPFDFESIDFLEQMGISKWKIPSGEITNLPYLIRLARTRKEIILSTGMSTLEEIEQSIQVLRQYGAGKVTLLHCNTAYPTPYEEVNLRAMLTLKEKFKVDIGYSDHTRGIEVPIAAVAMGACIIEKHFTLDRNMEGPDHKASLEPDELRQMVEGIRHIQVALGDGCKEPSASERENLEVVRKSIVATRAISKGECLGQDNIGTKRPGGGISPMRWFDVLGQVAKRDFVEDEAIEL